MPRLTNSLTGVVVNVDDATAEQLGPEWGPAAGGAKAADSDAKTTRRTRRTD
ncbi:DUF7302 family protein [Arthrobacter sp. USHLN218]|uniref:DUF7302 family protein n=1 Tax=Arthrobacter sp. USHLN218 TaxID=3081232 RepID=UPI003018D9C4